jgi:hypothetical protein
VLLLAALDGVSEQIVIILFMSYLQRPVVLPKVLPDFQIVTS